MNLYLSKGGVQHKHHKYTRLGDLPYVDMNISAEECDCDLFLYVKGVKKEYVSRRCEGNRVRSFNDMMYDVCAQISNDWVMHGTDMVSSNTHGVEQLYRKIKSLKGPNMKNIPPYLTTRRLVKSQGLAINLPASYLYQMFDLYYLSGIVSRELHFDDMDNVWLTLVEGGRPIPDATGKMRIGWDENRIGSLQELCMRKLSTYNQVYGGRGKYPNTVYTMSNLEAKYFPALEKLIKPTHSMFGSGTLIGSNHSKTLNYIVELLDVKKFKGSRTWTFEGALKQGLLLGLNTSSGERATAPVRLNGEKREYIIDGLTYKVVTGGKKAYHMEYAEQEIREIRNMIIREGKAILKDKAWTYVPKNEVLAGMTDEEIVKFFYKLRLFCIPSMVLAVCQRMVHCYRQNIERGNHIAIGISFWNGGAMRLAKSLFYDSDDYMWFTADFSAFDTTVKAHMLMIYSYFSIYYYKKDTDDYNIYKEMLRMVADNLTLKVVHLYDDIWKMIFGGMPSGAYETSHGDSWISMYIYIQYLINVCDQYPKYRKDIHDSIMARKIMFYVYGDDTVFCVEKKFKDIINIETLSVFVKEHFGMDMRDLITLNKFLSKPNPYTGNLDEKGVVFLSRYFVRRCHVTTRKDLPEVLPYREFTKIIKKYAFGDGSYRLPVDYVLASIGMAYDTFGTNKVGYEFCRFMYDSNMRAIGCNSFEEVLNKYADHLNNKNLNALYKKCGISISELSKGFPSLDSLLDRHKDDGTRHFMRDEGYDIETAFGFYGQ